jgi:TRAP-type mannitol/chloroaromatic compound transport system permease large subunit
VTDVADSRVEARRGQLAALALGLVAVVSGAIVAGVASPTAGGFIAVSGVTAILTAFLNQRANKPLPDSTGPTGSEHPGAGSASR